MRVLATVLFTLCATPLFSQSLEDPRLRVETWANGLSNPTCLTFVGPGEMLVFQNYSGRVLRVRNGVVMNTALDLLVGVQGGLGIARDPNFARNGYVYLYYTESERGEGGDWAQSLVMRYTFDGTLLHSPFGPLFACPFDPSQANENNHNSGYLQFGPDGNLYGQMGDKHRGAFSNPRIEQNTGGAAASGAGGIFRVAPDGSIPPDNPFVGEPNVRLHPWYVYGFRNSLGMDFDPLTDVLWFSDNGSTVYDEINRAGSGMNSGWLKIMGPDSRDAVYPENLLVPYDEGDLIQLAGSFYRDPEFSFRSAIGVTSICFLRSKRFPYDLENDLLVGESNFGQLYKLELDQARTSFVLPGPLEDRVADSAKERDLLRFGSGFGTTTDMCVGPDGYVYVVDYFGSRIRRLRPVIDLYEPMGLSVISGTLEQGSIADLRLSDDVYIQLGPTAPPAAAHRELEVTTYLNAAVPVRMDITVEAHSSRSNGWQLIEAWHVPSSSWRVLDVRPLSLTDQVVSILDLANPSEYVEPNDRSVRLRVKHVSSELFFQPAVSRDPAPPAFRSLIDQIQVAATLP